MEKTTQKFSWWKSWFWLGIKILFSGIVIGLVWLVAVKTYKMPEEIKARIAKAKAAKLNSSTQKT